jgi:hypothetical protein
MSKTNSPGGRVMKGLSLKSKWKITIISSFFMIGFGILFFCESFYRVKFVSEKSTWYFFLFMSTLIIFIGLHLFSLSIGYKTSIKTKKRLRKERWKKLKKYDGSEKLEIQKSPQKEG